MHWDRAGLEAEGFRGFVPFAALPTAGVPLGAGVYVVYRDSTEPPTFFDQSCGGHFKGKDPTVPVPLLQSVWADGAHVINIGKAALGASGRRGLHKRLNEYRRFGEGAPVGHWGGRYVWQLADSPALLVAWRETPDEDPRVVESRYIADFIRHYGQRPFANLSG
jgi:hypothetical protein